MAAALGKHLDAKGTGAPLVVIDEAHHAAPNTVRYGPLFARKNLGILGLTATPSRHDGEPLEFERRSFSIGFPDLVKLGIVLKPEVRKVQGAGTRLRIWTPTMIASSLIMWTETVKLSRNYSAVTMNTRRS